MWCATTLGDKGTSGVCRKIASASHSCRQWRKSPSGRMHRLSSSLISSFTQGPLRATPRFDRSSPSSVRVQICLMEHKLAPPQRNSADTETRVEKTRNDGFNGSLSFRGCSKGVRWLTCVLGETLHRLFKSFSEKGFLGRDVRSPDKLVAKLEKWNKAPKMPSLLNCNLSFQPTELHIKSY